MEILLTVVLGVIGSLIAGIVGALSIRSYRRTKRWWKARHRALYISQNTSTLPSSETIALEAANIFGGRVVIVTDTLLSHPADPKRIQQFYAGAKLDWDIIAAGGDIPRDQHEDFLKQAGKPFKAMRLVCIIAEAGAGKSTSAWRIAAELHKRHKALVVHVKDGDDPDVWYRLPEFYSKVGRPFYILVDDLFHDVNAANAFCQLHPWLPVTVLATSRPNEDRARRLKCETLRLKLNPPSLDEKERILKKLGKTRANLTAEQQRRLDDANQFLVLMIELTEGKELAQIVRDTVERLHKIDEPAYRAYEYLCFTFSMPERLLERLDSQGRFHNLPERETTQGLIFGGNREGYIRAGHPVIAKTAAEFYKRDPLNLLCEIAAALDATNYVERRFFTALIASLARVVPPVFTTLPKPVKSAIADCVQRAERVSELVMWRNFFRHRKQPILAERCVDHALKLNPTSGEDCNILVGLYRDRGREREALPIVANWIKEHPEKGGAHAVFLGLVEKYHRLDDVEFAQRATGSWLAAHPDDLNVRIAWLSFFRQCGSDEFREKAIEETKAWLAGHEWAKEAWSALLALLLHIGWSEASVELAKKAVSYHPDNLNLLEHYLRAVQGTADEQEVRSTYERLIAKSPTATNFQVHYAAWLRDHGYYLEAEERYKILMRIPDNQTTNSLKTSSHYGYGELLLKMERPDEAVVQFRSALNLAPKHHTAYGGLARALAAAGDFKQAEQVFQKAIHCASSNGLPSSRIYSDYGWFNLNQGRQKKALDIFKSARSVQDPASDHWKIDWGVGKASYELGDYVAALVALNIALKKKPDIQPPADKEIAELRQKCLQYLSKAEFK
jgi:tetratricopeptide (TPR) repeat protein